jgi:hypothetical protein
MPPHLAPTLLRLNNILTCFQPSVSLLQELSDAFNTPFVPAIAKTASLLITTIQVRYLYV